jgi:AraC-like DNA-binding protein/transcriptional regulator with XRE-family HTH domain
MHQIGSYIRKIRFKRGYSLDHVASRTEINPLLLSKIETAHRNATKDQIITLASFLGVDEKEMLIAYLTSCNTHSGNGKKSPGRLQSIQREIEYLDNGKIRTRSYIPEYPLRHFIENVSYYDGYNHANHHQKLLPDGSIQLVFAFDGSKKILRSAAHSTVTVTDGWLVGIHRHPVIYVPGQFESSITIRFAPGGLYALTGLPADEIENTVISLEICDSAFVPGLQERLLACTDTNSMFRVIDRYFSNRLSDHGVKRSVVAYILKNLNIPMSQLAEKTGYSHKHMIDIFKKQVGVAPKHFQRIKRFNYGLNDLLAMTRGVDWYDIIHRLGYHDQSHFIREFNKFTGVAPTAFLKTGNTCSKIFHVNG